MDWREERVKKEKKKIPEIYQNSDYDIINIIKKILKRGIY